MTRKLTRHTGPKAISLAMAGILAPTIAMAGFTLGDTMPTTEEALRAELGNQGYVVQEIEIEDGLLEVEVTRDGLEYELLIKPDANGDMGSIIEAELESEEDDD